MVTIRVEPQPTMRAAAFTTEFPEPLARVPTPARWAALLRADAEGLPLTRDEDARAAVRDMLRHGGYKPTGRGKPASEYLVRAAGEGALHPINAAVDACNIVSLHSGLPISVVDLERCQPPHSIRLASAGERYVFNPAGQEIELAGLPCLCDRQGPCGNAVKDAQRTKTDAGTAHTLSVVWGAAGHESRLRQAITWYRALLEETGATTEAVELI